MQNLLLIGLVLGAGYLFLKERPATPSTVPLDKRKWLSDFANKNNSPTAVAAIAKMSTAEIDAAYDYIANYYLKGIKEIPATLARQIDAISIKYQIFT